MKPEGSLLCSQQTATGPHPPIVESSPQTTEPVLNNYFNIDLSKMPRSLAFPVQVFGQSVCISVPKKNSPLSNRLKLNIGY